MWHLVLDDDPHCTLCDVPLRGKRPVLCTLELIARAAISMGDVRHIASWNFSRHEPKKGPKLKPFDTTTRSEQDTRRSFHLKKPGAYIVDSISKDGARAFSFFLLTASSIDMLTRAQLRDHFFALGGLVALDEALVAHAWTRAWIVAMQAPAAQREDTIARCVDSLRATLRATTQVNLEGRPKQIQWAEPLRIKAMALLRATWRSLAAHPTLPREQPRLLYALMTCAWAMKTERRAELFIAADYHISQARIGELVDRFSALGRYMASTPKSLAPPLSEDELATIQNLAGAIRP